MAEFLIARLISTMAAPYGPPRRALGQLAFGRYGALNGRHRQEPVSPECAISDPISRGLDLPEWKIRCTARCIITTGRVCLNDEEKGQIGLSGMVRAAPNAGQPFGGSSLFAALGEKCGNLFKYFERPCLELQLPSGMRPECSYIEAMNPLQVRFLERTVEELLTRLRLARSCGRRDRGLARR